MSSAMLDGMGSPPCLWPFGQIPSRISLLVSFHSDDESPLIPSQIYKYPLELVLC
jgi:hypothetical protein